MFEWVTGDKWAGQAVLCCICRTTPVYEFEQWEVILPSEDDFLFNVSPVCDLILWKFTLLATDDHRTWELRIARQLLLGQPLPLLSLVHSQNGWYQLLEGLICIIICNNELWTSYLLRNAWEIQRCWFLKISLIPDLSKSQGEICNKLSKASYLYDQSANPFNESTRACLHGLESFEGNSPELVISYSATILSKFLKATHGIC